ncbi:MAG: hypothetical protein ABIL09_22860 [Gemmatimonadota bacterium]
MWRTDSGRYLAAALAAAAAALAAVPGAAQAQATSGLGQGLWPRYEMEYVRPEMHRWYGPAHLAETYASPWYQVDTRYDREAYSRYVESLMEGNQYYDAFGHYIGRGWHVYTWEQQQAARNGSLIRTGAYGGQFARLVVAADDDARGTNRLMVGSEISTLFTPLTFSKPRFAGVRLDRATDRYAASLILSRPNDAELGAMTNATHVMGGHVRLQAAPAATVGATYVNAHNVLTQRDFSFGNPMRGTLSSQEDQPLSKLWVRLRDDSPADGRGGATLYRHEIVLIDTAGQRLRGIEIGFGPRVQGGRQEGGALIADGSEAIVLEYDLLGLDPLVVQRSALQRVVVELSLANDYRVEVASDLQTGGETRDPEIVYLTVRRAPGNVQDESNGRLVRLDYSLPTGSEVIGVDWNLVDWHGLSLQGEAVLNRRYGRYPGPRPENQHLVEERAHAGYLTAAYRRGPWTAFVEAFSLADDYATRFWLVERDGLIRYDYPVPQLYEFVEDDDDQDTVPEWERPKQLTSKGIAWPGYDENGDLRYDSNANANLMPDYEEPFLRFRSDRPEFLFGLDMNHNGTIDRFENDLEADYPYRRDHRGYNAYLSAAAGPDAQLTLGRQRLRLLSGDGRTRAWYAMLAWVHAGRGPWRLRLYDFGARVRDDIPDPVSQWLQPLGAVGRVQEVDDPMACLDTWRNTLYADCEHRLGEGFRMLHRARWELLVQRDGDEALRDREGRRRSGFLGFIDKAEWRLPVGLGSIEPRWKSELRFDRPYSRRQPRAASVEQTATLLWVQPLMAEQVAVTYYARHGRQLFDTELQVGLEASRFWLLEGSRQDAEEDYASWTLAAQLTNRVAYEGYQLVTRAGVQWTRKDLERGEDQRASLLFVTMNAGLN